MGLITVLGKECPFNTLSMGSIQSKSSISGSDFIAFSIEWSCVLGTGTDECGDKMVNQTDMAPLLPKLII